MFEAEAVRRATRQNDQKCPIGIPLDPKSNLVLEGFTYEQYRVGCPPLQILPLESHYVPTNSPARTRLRELSGRIREIIQRHGMTLDRDAAAKKKERNSRPIQVVYRTLSDGNLSPSHLTLLIRAVWDDSAPYRWLLVASDLRTLLTQQQDPHTAPIRVEIIGGGNLNGYTIDDIDANHPIIPLWDKILNPEVHKSIDESQLKDRRSSIGVLRMEELRAPLPTVVSIMVD